MSNRSNIYTNAFFLSLLPTENNAAISSCEEEGDGSHFSQSSSPSKGSFLRQSHHLIPLRTDGPKQSSIQARIHDGWVLHGHITFTLNDKLLHHNRKIVCCLLAINTPWWKPEIYLHIRIRIPLLDVVNMSPSSWSVMLTWNGLMNMPCGISGMGYCRRMWTLSAVLNLLVEPCSNSHLRFWALGSYPKNGIIQAFGWAAQHPEETWRRTINVKRNQLICLPVKVCQACPIREIPWQARTCPRY